MQVWATPCPRTLSRGGGDETLFSTLSGPTALKAYSIRAHSVSAHSAGHALNATWPPRRAAGLQGLDQPGQPAGLLLCPLPLCLLPSSQGALLQGVPTGASRHPRIASRLEVPLSPLSALRSPKCLHQPGQPNTRVCPAPVPAATRPALQRPSPTQLMPPPGASHSQGHLSLAHSITTGTTSIIHCRSAFMLPPACCGAVLPAQTQLKH